jgi:Dolichyl-phosphate-mannose-protein mannosyltransferase
MSRLTVRSKARMSARPTVLDSTRSLADPYGRTSLAVIVAVMLCQIAFLVFGCDWDFCNDEAEYWAWSRRLDWSYYSRGPLIAWVIRLATELLGGLSVKLTGSLMFAARLPAVLLGGLTAWGVFRLASLTTGQRRAAMMSVVLLPAIPILAIGGVVITSDTPLVCCWTWAAVWTYRGARSDDLRSWVAAGLIGALGVWAKYSFLAFPASVGLFLLISKAHRSHLLRPGFWTMVLLCLGMGLAPILIWNFRHGWAGAGQLADRVGLSSRATWASIGPVLTFLGGDAAALGGVWWIAGIAAVVAAIARVIGRSRSVAAAEPDETAGVNDSGLIYLLCLWGVIWTACLAASLLGENEANWMVPGYISLVILIALRVDRVFADGGVRKWVYTAAWCLCLAVVIAIHHVEWFYPALARYLPEPTPRWPVPLRVYEPTARMRGHQTLARAVEKTMEALDAKGVSPYVLTPTYGLASTLSFYLPGQPETYCLSWNYGMTPQPVNQHDLWHPNPRHDPAAFRARAAIVVEDANMPPNWAYHMFQKRVFGSLESTERVTVRERGVIVGAWDISICHDYRGVADYQQFVPGRRRLAGHQQISPVRR